MALTQPKMSPQCTYAILIIMLGMPVDVCTYSNCIIGQLTMTTIMAGTTNAHSRPDSTDNQHLKYQHRNN